jgi:hypothetical protein
MTGAASFPEIVGHRDLVARLSSLIEGGRLGLGILIVGEEGRGKRTVAHALARDVLMRAAPAAEAARVGKLIASGAHPGLVHLEPLRDERFHPVRRIRRLLESCALKVGFGDRRVVVLARLHAVNEESGNALLKFLEEPPSGTLVIATARDRAAVLETIRSRFLILAAGPLARTDVDAVLERGGIEAPDRDVLAPLCQGAPGRAWSLARGNVESALIAPVRLFFDPATPIHGAIEALVRTAKDQGAASALDREGIGPPAAVRALRDLRAAQAAEIDDERRGETTLEAARVWVKPVVLGVAFAIQELLRERSGAATSAAVLAPRVVPEDAALRGAPEPRLTQALAAAVACLDNIDRNLTLTLALEALALRLRAG